MNRELNQTHSNQEMDCSPHLVGFEVHSVNGSSSNMGLPSFKGWFDPQAGGGLRFSGPETHFGQIGFRGGGRFETCRWQEGGSLNTSGILPGRGTGKCRPRMRILAWCVRAQCLSFVLVLYFWRWIDSGTTCVHFANQYLTWAGCPVWGNESEATEESPANITSFCTFRTPCILSGGLPCHWFTCVEFLLCWWTVLRRGVSWSDLCSKFLLVSSRKKRDPVRGYFSSSEKRCPAVKRI